jgi:hypothetical protein
MIPVIPSAKGEYGASFGQGLRSFAAIVLERSGECLDRPSLASKSHAV